MVPKSPDLLRWRAPTWFMKNPLTSPNSSPAGNRSGKNMIWDITMSSRESTERRIYSSGPRDTPGSTEYSSTSRWMWESAGSEARHREGHDRYRAGVGWAAVSFPPRVIASQADPDWGSRNRRTFERMKPRLDGWLCVTIRSTADGRSSSIPAAGKGTSDERGLRSHQGLTRRDHDPRRSGATVPRAEVAAPPDVRRRQAIWRWPPERRKTLNRMIQTPSMMLRRPTIAASCLIASTTLLPKLWQSRNERRTPRPTVIQP